MLITEEYKAYLILKTDYICVSTNNPPKDSFQVLQCDGFLQCCEYCYLVLCPPEGCRLACGLCRHAWGQTHTRSEENQVNKGNVVSRNLKLRTKLVW